MGVYEDSILCGGNDGRGFEGFAFGTGDEVAHILKVGGEDIFCVFIGRVHEHIVAGIVECGGDGMIEKGWELHRLFWARP